MSDILNRKQQHIDIVLNEKVEPTASSFDEVKLQYTALPEINMNDIDMSSTFFGTKISIPLIISSMTGGSEYGRQINENLAIACEQEKIPFGLGSMRIILENDKALETFDVKNLCPSVPMFGNIGLIQLNYGVNYDSLQFLIDTVKVDGMFFHINHLQEAIQPGGDTNYKDIINKFAKVIKKIRIPIVVKEVGHGVDLATARRLRDIGVEWIDVSGTGGTSWALIEGYRRNEKNKVMDQENLGYLFRNEGIKTIDCLRELRNVEGLNLIAGGGVRNGLHIAKSIALGAKYATSASPFLQSALNSSDDVVNLIIRFKEELKIAMFSTGVLNLNELSKKELA